MLLCRSMTTLGILSATLGLVACGGSSSSGPAEFDVQGLALSVLDKTAQPNRPFIVNDLSKTGADATVAMGTSDAFGRFLAKVGGDSPNVLVAFPPAAGQPRTSGLFALLDGDGLGQGKSLDDVTDIACQAGASAVGDMAIAATDLSSSRIANLESGAQRVLDTQTVDFNDSDSVTAAANEVRRITRQGEFGLSPEGEFEFRGTARSVVDGTAQADRPFVVRDLARSGPEAIVASGQSDALGAFLVKVGGDVTNVLISFGANGETGEPRSSGLISLVERESVDKPLDGATDIACQAGAGAVGDGSITAGQVDAERIANLEAGAQQVLQTQSVDFSDADSVAAAAAQVREITNDGAQPPAS